MHDEHVGVGLADVVLDGEAGPDAARGGRKAGMAEGELGRTVEALHERAHAVAILIIEAVDARAIDVFDSGRGCDLVQHSMQVHHQAMEAVLAPSRAEARLVSSV